MLKTDLLKWQELPSQRICSHFNLEKALKFFQAATYKQLLIVW